jgi:hypothetical protein
LRGRICILSFWPYINLIFWPIFILGQFSYFGSSSFWPLSFRRPLPFLAIFVFLASCLLGNFIFRTSCLWSMFIFGQWSFFDIGIMRLFSFWLIVILANSQLFGISSFEATILFWAYFLCPVVSFSNCHFVQISFGPILILLAVILTNCHCIKLLLWPLVILTKCNCGQLSILAKYALSKCNYVQLSLRPIAIWKSEIYLPNCLCANCHCGQLSLWPIVIVANCHCGQLSL